MKKRFLQILFLTMFLVSLSHAGDQKSEAIKAGGAAAGGAVAGGVTFAAIGSGGLAIAGTAVTIGAAPFVAAGAVVGLAGYGVYRIFADSDSPESSSTSGPPPRTAKPAVGAKR